MSDTVYLRQKVRDMDESPAYQPISRIRINAGTDSDGNAIIYEAGNANGRTIEVDNPIILDSAMGNAVAQRVLAALEGYKFKPFKASGAILDPAAEIGDAVSVNGIYSVLADIETTFSPLMTANISAPEDGSIDHEFPYESPTDRALARTDADIGDLKTEFIVEQGRVAWTISQIGSQTEEGSILNRLTSVETTVNGIKVLSQEQVEKISGDVVNDWAEANFTAKEINTKISSYYDASGTAAGYYEELTGQDGVLDERDATITAAYESAIKQSARSIEATVAGQESKWDLGELPSGVSISVYGFGNPNGVVPAGGDNRNKYYLDQSTGRYYRSNGTSWVLQTRQLELITNRLQSALNINANSISSLLTSSSEHGSAISSIEQMINSITLSVSNGIDGKASFELGYQKDDNQGGTTYTRLASDTFDVHVKSVNISGELTANSVAANASISSPNISGGTISGSVVSGGTIVGSYFMDASQAAQMTLTSYGGYPGGGVLYYGPASQPQGPYYAYFQVTGIGNTTNPTAYVTLGGTPVGYMSGGTFYAQGAWNFSGASVSGLPE